jgi:hypothetical protein
MNEMKDVEAYVDGGLNIMSASLSLVDPAYGMIAMALQPAISIKLKDWFRGMINKGLTKREFDRLDKAIDGMASTIEENQKENRRTNQVLLSPDTEGFSSADDIFEVVLKQIKNDSDRRKTFFTGCFLGNVSFANQLSYSNLMQYERIISQLTYSHLCVLYVLSEFKSGSLGNKKCNGADIYARSHSDPDTSEVYSELLFLKTLGLVRSIPPYNLGAQVGSVEISDLGIRLCELMRLNLLEKEDVNKSLSILNNFCQ